MAKADKTNADTVKNRITSHLVEWRTLGKNSLVNGDNNATFIGASNRVVADMFPERGGQRRFYQIDVQPKMDWALIKSDRSAYVELWKSVDESMKSPIAAIWADVKKQSETRVENDDVETFYYEQAIELATEKPAEWTRGTSWFAQFIDWMKDNNMDARGWNPTRFGRRMKQFLPPKLWSTPADKTGTYYKLTSKYVDRKIGKS